MTEGILAEIVEHPLELQKLYESVVTSDTGAINSFVGTVRNNFDGKQVVSLEYYCYVPMAEKVLREICSETCSRFEINRVAVQHRYGRLEIKDASVAIAVSAGHRKEAFEACRFVIEAIKTRLPVWKKEYFRDGSVWKEGVPVQP